MSTTDDRQGTRKKPRGPQPERLNLKGDWQSLVGKALKKQRPKKGWPTPKGEKK